MRIDIISVAPELIESPFQHSIMQRAQSKGLAEVHFHNLRDYAVNSYGKIDDYQFGGGAGMVLMVEPIDKCISKLKSERSYDEIIYMTPDAPVLKQAMANKLSAAENLIILTGHYKGVDQRVRDRFITLEISIGDYVLSGGELAAAVLCDAVIRLIPGVIGDETSALSDSFQDGLLKGPDNWQNFKPDGGSYVFWDMAIDSLGRVWLLDRDSLYLWDNSSWNSYDIDNDYLYIYIDKDNQVWLDGDKFDSAGVESLDPPTGLKLDFDSSPLKPLVDINNNIWFKVTDYFYPIGLVMYDPDGSSLANTQYTDAKPLLINSPNPFYGSTRITFNSPGKRDQKLLIYNTKGELVYKTAAGCRLPAAGFVWDASRHSSGIYFVKLMDGERVYTRKMVLLR